MKKVNSRRVRAEHFFCIQICASEYLFCIPELIVALNRSMTTEAGISMETFVHTEDTVDFVHKVKTRLL